LTKVTFFVTLVLFVGGTAMTGQRYIDEMASRGRYHFTSREAENELGGSTVAVRAVLRRLKEQGLVATPFRGFHVIVPPEYRSMGCLPADQFVPALLEHLGAPYYAGLLTAAERHGAAHQRPQEFQVVTDGSRADLACGAVRVVFIARRDAREVPTVQMNTPRGFLRVSTPEATALDLVTYPRQAGGLDNVAGVLAELAESIDPVRLAKVAARVGEVSVAQRLGYLLDAVGVGARSEPLADLVARRSRHVVPLVRSAQAGGTVDRRWKVQVNVVIEVET
jgi:predicted transcriptional regulator of viral defense system